MFAFSQESYPRKIRLDGDTCVVISIPQLKVINSRLLERRYLKMAIDSLSVYASSLNSFIKVKNGQIDSIAKLASNYRFKLQNEMILNSKYREENIELKTNIKRKKRNFWIAIGLGFFTGFLLAR